MGGMGLDYVESLQEEEFKCDVILGIKQKDGQIVIGNYN